MSLLEDIFLQDEANEAQELERIIEGDEFDERRPHSDSDDNSERENEAEEEKRRVDPTSAKTRRVIKNPRFILNPARLTGPRGIQVIPEHFKDFKFKGKGHEKEDLDLVLKKLEHWAYRLYPKFEFEDCLKKIETLGKKRPVMVHLQKIRTDQYMSEEVVVQKDSSDDDVPAEDAPPEDEFDKLLQQQIELVRSTAAPNSIKKGINSTRKENITLLPKATSSPSISEEQRDRILKSRKLAEERRLARLKNSNFNTPQNHCENNTNIITDDSSFNYEKEPTVETPVASSSTKKAIDSEIDIGLRRVNRTNVIESSDEEDVLMNESIRVDVHKDLSTVKDPRNFNTCKQDQDKNIDELEQLGLEDDNKESDDSEIISTEKNSTESDILGSNSKQNLEKVTGENDYIKVITEKDEAIAEVIKTNVESLQSDVEKITDEIDEQKIVEVENNDANCVEVKDTVQKEFDNDIEDLMDVDFNDDF